MATEAQILADTFERTRELNRWYLSNMKGQDMTKTFEVNGITLNNAKWLAGHLVWAENALLLRAIGGKGIDLPWLRQFGVSKPPTKESNAIDIKTILDGMKVVHSAAMTYIRQLPDTALDEQHLANFTFGDKSDKRIVIQHAIRHEGGHAGQLGILCRLYGISTV